MKHYRVTTGDPAFMDTGGETYLIHSNHDSAMLAVRKAHRLAADNPGVTYHVERLPLAGARVWTRIEAIGGGPAIPAVTTNRHEIVKDVLSALYTNTTDHPSVRDNSHGGVDIMNFDDDSIVRIAMEDPESGIEIYGFTPNLVLLWSARFTLNAPIRGIIETVRAAL